jgi:hypothetical protein
VKVEAAKRLPTKSQDKNLGAQVPLSGSSNSAFLVRNDTRLSVVQTNFVTPGSPLFLCYLEPCRNRAARLGLAGIWQLNCANVLSGCGEHDKAGVGR